MSGYTLFLPAPGPRARFKHCLKTRFQSDVTEHICLGAESLLADVEQVGWCFSEEQSCKLSENCSDPIINYNGKVATHGKVVAFLLKECVSPPAGLLCFAPPLVSGRLGNRGP